MKKRILSAVLAVVILSTLIVSFSVTASATTMGKTVGEMVSELTNFISIANNQIKRDDYKNMPAGMQTEHEATKVLKAQVEEAKALRKAKSDPDAEANIDAFLVELFGGWDPEANEGVGDYKDSNKPYGDFQNAMALRYPAIEPFIYYGDKGYTTIKREDYTLDSWNTYQAFVTKMELGWFTVCDDYPYSRLAVASRSEVYYLIQDYYAAFDKLVKFEGDEAAKEVNRVKGDLYDILQFEKDFGMTVEDYVARMDVDVNDPVYQEVKRLLGLGDKVALRDELVKFMADAEAAYNNPNATFEEVDKFICHDLFKNTISGAVACDMSEIQDHLDNDEWIIAGTQVLQPIPKRTATGRIEKDEEGNIIYETDKSGRRLYQGTGYFFNKFAFRDQKAAAFNESLFTAHNFRIYKTHKYHLPIFEEYNAGIFTKEDYNLFLRSFELGDATLGRSESKESDFMKALDEIKAGYEEILTKRQVEKIYRPYGETFVKFYNECVAKGLAADGETPVEYDVDSVRHFKQAVDYFLEALENLDRLVAEGKQDSDEYKYWEDYAQSRVYDMIDTKDGLVIIEKQEETAGGAFVFYHNNAKILDAAKTILEKAELYKADVEANGDKFNQSGNDYPFPDDTFANFAVSVRDLKQALNAIEKYEKAIADYEAAYEKDPATAEPTVDDGNAVLDETLVGLINGVYTNLTAMQIEYRPYEG